MRTHKIAQTTTSAKSASASNGAENSSDTTTNNIPSSSKPNQRFQAPVLTLHCRNGKITKISLRRALNCTPNGLLAQLRFNPATQPLVATYLSRKNDLSEQLALDIIDHLVPNAIVHIGF